MNFLKIVSFTAAIILSCCSVSEQGNKWYSDFCRDKCKDTEVEWVCKPRDGWIQVISKCAAECERIKLPDDQNDCFYEYCKSGYGVLRTVQNGEFCTAPGADALTKVEECDSMVRTGKAKYYGREHCKQNETESGESDNIYLN